jgi:ribonuclease HII
MDLAAKKALNAALTLFPSPNGEYEQELQNQGYSHIVGVDEVGRGPLAGPVVAAAVMFPKTIPQGLRDSKLLKTHQREKLFEIVADCAIWSVSCVPASLIDTLNIRGAALLAMKRALEGLPHIPDLAFIDGRDQPDVSCTCLPVIRGDSRIASIAAASIMAKVVRDRMMARLDAVYPNYGFARHVGYGTVRHLEALKKLGPCPHHRKSFAPLKNIF